MRLPGEVIEITVVNGICDGWHGWLGVEHQATYDAFDGGLYKQEIRTESDEYIQRKSKEIGRLPLSRSSPTKIDGDRGSIWMRIRKT